MAAGRPLRVGALVALAIAATFFTGCDKVENSPHQLAEQFVSSLRTADKNMFAGLMDWEQLAINQYYVTRDYYDSLTPENQRKLLADYRQAFMDGIFPAASKANYTVEEVYVARNSSDAIISIDFRKSGASGGNEQQTKQFTLEMSLIQDGTMWYIINLNDFVQLNMLDGEYNPDTFYLPDPIR